MTGLEPVVLASIIAGGSTIVGTVGSALLAPKPKPQAAQKRDPVMPMADDSKVRAARQRSRQQISMRSGRNSTMLSPGLSGDSDSTTLG